MFRIDYDPNLNDFDSTDIDENSEQTKLLGRILFDDELTENTLPSTLSPGVQPVEVKSEDTNTEFDLIKFIILGDDVSFKRYIKKRSR